MNATPLKVLTEEVREHETPYNNIARLVPSTPTRVDYYRSSQYRSPSSQSSPPIRIISNPLVDMSFDNSQLVADNPLDQSVESVVLTTICLLYSNNFEATRYKDYI